MLLTKRSEKKMKTLGTPLTVLIVVGSIGAAVAGTILGVGAIRAWRAKSAATKAATGVK
jgi:uncharacterized protein (DUF2062 family)